MKLKDFKKEIKVLDIAGLIARAKALKLELADLVLDKNINKVKNLRSISTKRKDLARVLTTLNQKQMIVGLEVKEVKTEEPKAEKEEKVKKGAEKK